MMGRPLVAVAVVAALSLSVHAQSKTPEPAANSLSGTVLGPGGRPVVGASVWTSSADAQTRKDTVADDAGHFELAGLERGSYTLSASSQDLVMDGVEANHRIGDTVTIRLVKGGVITGRVTDRAGDPVVAVNVRARQIKDAAGKAQPATTWAPNDTTDDRGVYRIYGLNPGSYVVMAGHASGADWGLVSSRDGDAPTYYPSSTRESATVVAVSTSQELTGIDIAYRGDRGHAISGRLAGPAPTSDTSASVVVSRAGEVEVLASSYLRYNDPDQEFSLSGLTDGEYDVRASRSNDSGGGMFSSPKRVTLRGADVTGLLLDLVPYSAIAGKVVLEKADPTDESCQRGRAGALSEITFVTVRTGGLPRPASDMTGAVDHDGAFKVGFLRPALYHLDIKLPDARWYVRDIVRGDPAKPQASATPAPDLVIEGLALGQGQRADDLRIHLADGAASVAGRIKPVVEGGPILPSARVYLVPTSATDPITRDDYYSTWALADGSFKLEHVAPGSYLAVVRSEPLDAIGVEPQPAYWDSTSRAQLRKDAAKATPIELAKCQDVAGFDLAAPATPAAHKHRGH